MTDTDYTPTPAQCFAGIRNPDGSTTPLVHWREVHIRGQIRRGLTDTDDMRKWREEFGYDYQITSEQRAA